MQGSAASLLYFNLFISELFDMYTTTKEIETGAYADNYIYVYAGVDNN